MMFWYTTLVLILGSGFLIWLFYKRQVRVGALEEASNEILYETRTAEIDQDVSMGRMDASVAEAARNEAARQFLRNAPDAAHHGNTDRYGKLLLVSCLSLFPLFSLLLYLYLGTPPKPPAVQSASLGVEGENGQIPSIEDLLKTAEERLEQNPDDARGWRVVAPVYIRQERYDDAIRAFQNLLRIEGETTGVLASLGEVMTAKAEGAVSGEALELFRKSVALDQRNATANFFIGLHALQNENIDLARETWQSMVDRASGDEDWLPVMRQRIANLSPETRGPDEGEADLDGLPEEQAEMINDMVAGLATRLADDPSDKEGWFRLVRSYLVLQRIGEAQSAATDAKSHHGDDSDFVRALDDLLTAARPSGSTGGNGE